MPLRSGVWTSERGNTMIKTKLILVDGITGSGKSTMAHFIARQLNKNGIRAKWIYELEDGNPLWFTEDREDHKEFVENYLLKYPKQLRQIADNIEKDDQVYVIESFLFQNILMPLREAERSEIDAFYKEYSLVISKLNPVIIHLYQNDVEMAVRENWRRRGDSWKEMMIKSSENTLTCRKRNLKGEKADITLWQEWSKISHELYQVFEFDKMQIENSAHNWEMYRDQVCKFLQIKKNQDVEYESSFDRFSGDYKGKGYTIKVHKLDNHLCIDLFWPNLRLISASVNEFEVEGFPIKIKFIENEINKDQKIIFTKILMNCYHDEPVKFIPFVMSEPVLRQFCGDYKCDEDKLERKIYLKGGSLYYWRDEKNESKLIPITKTQFMMVIWIENQLDFEFVDGEWQFTFDVKGDKPSKTVFVKKKVKSTEK